MAIGMGNSSGNFMSTFVLIALMSFSIPLMSQDTVQTHKASCKSEFDSLSMMNVYTEVDSLPRFPGGDNEFTQKVMLNFVYPEQDYFQATFRMAFVIDQNGKLMAPRVKGKIKDEWTPAEKEIVKILNQLDGWQPGYCGKEKVPVLVRWTVRL